MDSDVEGKRLRIFISYRRADSSAYAGRLFDGLVARFGADNVFMDIDAIPPGVDFREVVNEALSDCDILLAVIGRLWLQSVDTFGSRRQEGGDDDYVRMELESALQRPGIRVVPVLVQGVAMPASQDLPAGLAPLAYRNAFELSDRRWRLDVDTLCQVLARPVRRGPTIGRGRLEEQSINEDAGASIGFEDRAPEPTAAFASGGWMPTHTVPVGGLTSYSGAEDGGRPNGGLAAGLEVQLIRREGDWAQVVCSNGWTAWVDARQLIPGCS